MAVVVTKDNFTENVAQGVSLLDFWAPWCGPCKMQLPIVEELSEELKGQATIATYRIAGEQLFFPNYKQVTGS